MDKLTWAVVAGVLALVVSGLVAASLMRGRDAPPDVSTPGGVALAYTLAVQRGDGQAAWDLLTPSVQMRSDRERFLARVGSPRTDAEYAAIEDERIEGDSASVVLVRTRPGSGGIFGGRAYTTRTTVRLAREGAVWRITAPPDEFLLFDRHF